MELPSRTDMALTKMLNLIDQGPRDPGMTRNAVFKIADLLGIKMPHGIFASTPMLHSARKPLDLRRPPQPPFKAGDASIHAGELLNPRYRATAIKGALFHLGKYKEHAEDAKSEMGQHHATAAAKNKWLALAWTQVAEEDGQRVPSALSSFARKHSGRPLTSAELLKQANRIEVSVDDRYNTVTVAIYLPKEADVKTVQSAFKDVFKVSSRMDRELEEGELDVHAYDPVLVSAEARVSVTLLLSLGVTKASKQQVFEALAEANIRYIKKYF